MPSLSCMLLLVIHIFATHIHYLQVILPFPSLGSFSIPIMLTESIVSLLLVLVVLVMPELLHVNHVSKYYTSLSLLPLIGLTSLFHSSLYNPAATYAIWYVNGSSTPIQLEQIIGTVLGAVAAGYVMYKHFPDDPSSWIRTSQI